MGRAGTSLQRSIVRSGGSLALVRAIFILNTCGFILLTHADIFDLGSSNYIPKVRPDFSLNEIPCDLKTGSCARPGKSYPWFGMQNFIRENQATVKRMWGDACEDPSRTRPQGPMELRTARSDLVNACPSEQFVITPFWANNSAGTTLAVVNFHPFEQAVQQEVCKPELKGRCRDGCLCQQKYSWYRLLAFDPRNECRGIFMDWFQFPSCCTCQCHDLASPDSDKDPANGTEDARPTTPELPSPKQGSLSSTLPPLTTPRTAYTTSTASTTSTTDNETEDPNYDNDTTDGFLKISPRDMSAFFTTAPSVTSPNSTQSSPTTTTAIPKTTSVSSVSPLVNFTSTTNQAQPLRSSPAPSQASGTLKFPFNDRPEFVSVNVHHKPSQSTTTFRPRYATVPKAKTAASVSTATSTSKAQITTSVNTASVEIVATLQPDDTLETSTIEANFQKYASLWKIADPAMRKNRVPRI